MKHEHAKLNPVDEAEWHARHQEALRRHRAVWALKLEAEARASGIARVDSLEGARPSWDDVA